MIFHDVCNLFTNIPLKETIKLAVNLIFENCPEIRITRKQLIKLFGFATSTTHFMFSRNYYDQIDGMMGFPLGPVLANLYMKYHEKIWLEAFKTCKVVLYQWYVDDITCLFAYKKYADEFFTVLNSCHPNIKFSYGKEKDNKIEFLDIYINKTNQSCFGKVCQLVYTNYLLIKLILTTSI